MSDSRSSNSTSAHRRIIPGLILALGVLVCLAWPGPAQAQTYTVLHIFTGASATGTDGYLPQSLMIDSSGNLYGVSVYGGDGSIIYGDGGGTVFELANSGGTYAEKILHIFTGGADGDLPDFGLVEDSAGNLYGVTSRGAPGGEVFELSPSGTLTVIHSFSGTDGSYPTGRLVMDSAGNLYGATEYGGTGTCAIPGEPAGCGTVFELLNSGGTYTFQVLHNFQGPIDGGSGADLDNPPRGLVMDSAGNLYGVAEFGGNTSPTPNPAGPGGVFEMVNSNGSYSYQVVYRFTGHSDGAYPTSGVFIDASGNLYGTTQYGGTQGYGTIYKVSPSGTETTLLEFGVYPGIGTYAPGTPVMDAAGNLYGTTYWGGTYNRGTLFKLDPSGNLTVLHNFSGSDGWFPESRLILDHSGDLFGTTDYGGNGPCTRSGVEGQNPTGCGVAYEVKLDNYTAQIQPPIAADGSSVFNANRGVVPVKFTLDLNGQATCNLPAATISLTQTSGASSGTVNQDDYEMTADDGTSFRIDTTDCQYVYNLSAKNLGPGTYKVQILISGSVAGTGTFGLQ